MLKHVTTLSMVLVGLVLTGCSGSTSSSKDSLNLGAMIEPIPLQSVLRDEDYFVWGGSMVQTEDGTCHL